MRRGPVGFAPRGASPHNQSQQRDLGNIQPVYATASDRYPGRVSAGLLGAQFGQDATGLPLGIRPSPRAEVLLEGSGRPAARGRSEFSPDEYRRRPLTAGEDPRRSQYWDEWDPRSVPTGGGGGYVPRMIATNEYHGRATRVATGFQDRPGSYLTGNDAYHDAGGRGSSLLNRTNVGPNYGGRHRGPAANEFDTEFHQQQYRYPDGRGKAVPQNLAMGQPYGFQSHPRGPYFADPNSTGGVMWSGRSTQGNTSMLMSPDQRRVGELRRGELLLERPRGHATGWNRGMRQQ